MNKTITIYELLGKIRNGEVPKKIIYRDYLCYYDDGDYKIKSVGEWLFANEYIDLSNLNDKVEIIEDNDKLEDNTIKTNEFKTIGKTMGQAYRELFEGFIEGWKSIEEKLDER